MKRTKRPSLAIGFALALATLCSLQPFLGVAQNGSLAPTQADVDVTLKQAQDQIGRMRAIDTQRLGYWIDPSTGLMWAAKDSGKDLSWRGAAKYCRKLRTAGYSDWRLASLDELEGIFDQNAFSPGLGLRESEPTAWHVKGYLFLTAYQWSSNERPDGQYFDFNSGRSNNIPTGWPYGYDYMHALCVRGSGDPLAIAVADHDPAASTPERLATINKALASSGNTNAAYELGLAYLQGYGVGRDLALAEHWFLMVANDPTLKSRIDLDAEARLPPLYLFELAETYRKGMPPETERATRIYVYLLQQTGHPEVRRAQMELGNFVLDGKFTGGNDAKGKALNLEWARDIAQELLGQEEYRIALDFQLGREDLPKDSAMWFRFCIRAAAYNIDFAQHFLAQALVNGTGQHQSSYDGLAWTRLASDKQTDEIRQLKAMESQMTSQQRHGADAAYDLLVQTHAADGAYYPPDDPLRSPSPAELAEMPSDDPDVQLRRAFALEQAAQTDDAAYREAMDLYRTVRDRRKMDVRFVLGRGYLNGTGGLPKNIDLARHWLNEAAGFGSQPAKALLATLPAPASN